jgi:hypothetical protein
MNNPSAIQVISPTVSFFLMVGLMAYVLWLLLTMPDM